MWILNVLVLALILRCNLCPNHSWVVCPFLVHRNAKNSKAILLSTKNLLSYIYFISHKRMYTYYEHTYKKCILQINSEIKDEHFQVCFFVPLTFRRKLHGQLNDIILCFTINRWGELVYLMLAPKMNLFFGESYSNIYNTTCQRNKYYTLPCMLVM